jgi:hypothetical protein
VRQVAISSGSIEALQALALGFAFAGLLASAFEVFAERPAGFSLLHAGGLAALASVPLVVFSAPFLIMRNTVRGQRIEKRPAHFVFLATIIACFWSLVCGKVVMDLALRLLTA